MKCPACRSENDAASRYCRRCGSLIDPTSSPTMTYTPAEESDSGKAFRFNPGQKFGDRYTIIEEIGRGGMGCVYKAQDQELGTTVALKMIRPELLSRPGMLDKFRQETLLGRSISHENVVRIHDMGEVQQVRYISMDFIRGENLCDLIQTSGSLALSTCLQIAIQVCRALRAAHGAGIIHQDLKPQNIMIDNSGRVYVTDFGLAKSASTDRAVHPGGISGTPKYFSPEQARGEESGPRSDIYSLGIILYEMVTGAAPFKADSLEGYIEKHISEKPRPPSKLNPGLLPACEKIILKCLEKNGADRYQSAEELLGELEAQLKNAKAGGAGGRKAGRLRGAAGAALVLLVGWIIIKKIVPAIWPPPPPPSLSPQPLVAVMYAVDTSGNKVLDEQLRWGIQHNLSTFLAQSRYLRVLRPDRLMSILQDMKQLDEQRHYSKTLDRISETANVGYFVLPSFTKAGDHLWISISVMKAKTDVTLGEPDTVKGTMGETIFAMVEELGQKVKSKLDLSPEEIAGDYNQSLNKITTPSSEALRFYTDGEKYYVQQDYAASIKSLEQAVREDPDFAMAYLKIADNYSYIGDYVKHRAYLQKAQSLVDRVSTRDRYLIQGYSSYALDESPLNAIKSYQELIRLYPQDEEARMALGAIRRNLEEWDLALEQFDQVLALNPENRLALENMAFIATAMGSYEKALGLCEAGVKAAPEHLFFIRQLPLLHLIRGQFDRASAEIEKASVRLPDNVDILELEGHLHHLEGDIPAARRLYGRMETIGEVSPQALDLRGRIWQARLLTQQGEYRQARTGILQGIELARKNSMISWETDLRLQLAYIELQLRHFSRAAETLKPVLEPAQNSFITRVQKPVFHLLGLAALGMGQIEEAKRMSRQLRLSIEQAGYRSQMRRHDHLLGHIALAEGRPKDAVSLFEHAISLLPSQRDNEDEQAFYLDGLAKAHFISGDWPRAIEAYQRIISLTTGRLLWGDIYATSFYWLGKAYQRSGDTLAAAARFEDFLRLWKDADTGLPEVDDATKQLEVLKKAR